ncbi:hypothetical protein Esi_0139_0019 [Ectocarpus siliculosus]|uniref:Uncharacterized protein n=1 Tax=Ectocarpus siliculosus TaxID=2880 RepID=D7FJZ5_ECTSI|nr:hypothetical protein Esi_0139_0019 [Ectocarpus siliculosus]|eukprot:CBJ49084.1 hypothetical protein Esi_0139_0019 [Ectocarpus siliculosus]
MTDVPRLKKMMVWLPRRPRSSRFSPPSDGTGSPTSFDAARAAMCLLKEEDHVWTIETCMETINLLRARNNALKEQLLDVDTNFTDHVQARQRKIQELTLAVESASAIKEQLEATVESERGDRRRQERDQQRQREAEAAAYQETIKALTSEVESLQGYSGERDRVNAQLAALEAANAELQDQQEIKLQSLRKKLSEVEAAKEDEVARLVLEAKENMRDEVEIAFGGAHERLLQENQELKDKLKQLDSKLQIILSELEHETAAKAGLKTELEIARAMESKSAGKIKYYMRMLKRSAAELAHQCESGGHNRGYGSSFFNDHGGNAAAADEASNLRGCQSSSLEGRSKAGAGRGDGVRKAPSKGGTRPGTAPAKVRSGGGRVGGREGGGHGNNGKAGEQESLNSAILIDGDCARQRSGCCSGGGGRGPGCEKNSQPHTPTDKPNQLRKRRAQTAARSRASAPTDNVGGNYGSRCWCGSGGNGAGTGKRCSTCAGGTKRHPRRRAQTADRSRARSSANGSPQYNICGRNYYPAPETPPPPSQSRPPPPRTGGDGGGDADYVPVMAADGRVDQAPARGTIDVVDTIGRHAQRRTPQAGTGRGGASDGQRSDGGPGQENIEENEAAAVAATAEGRKAGGRGRGEGEAVLLAERRVPQAPTCEMARPPNGGSRSGGQQKMKHDVGAAAAAAEVAAVNGGAVGDLPPSRCPKEGVDMERSGSAGDGRAVQNREHELFQTLIRRADPEKDAANSWTQQNLDLDNEPALRVDDHDRNCDTLAVGQQSWGEEERLLRAVDDGDLDLLSPRGRQQQDNCHNPPSRAARARAALAVAAKGGPFAASPPRPQQTVLVRERLGGVGTGAPTAPRQSEIDAVAAEEAAKAVMEAATAQRAAQRLAAAAAAAAAAAQLTGEAGGVGVGVAPAEAGGAGATTAAENATDEGGDGGNDGGGASGGFSRQDMMMMAGEPAGQRGAGETPPSRGSLHS